MAETLYWETNRVCYYWLNDAFVCAATTAIAATAAAAADVFIFHTSINIPFPIAFTFYFFSHYSKTTEFPFLGYQHTSIATSGTSGTWEF